MNEKPGKSSIGPERPKFRMIPGYGIVEDGFSISRHEANAARKSEREREKSRRHAAVIKWILIAQLVLSVAMLAGWWKIQRMFAIPVDFGLLSALVLFLLTGFIMSLVHSISRLVKNIKTHTHAGVVYYILLPVALLALLIVAGFYEFRHQLVQVIATPPTQMVSKNGGAIFQCDRLELGLAPKLSSVITRPGYVLPDDPNVVHAAESACSAIFNWYMSNGKDSRSTENAISSLDLIAHEAIHVGGENNELVAKCGAVDWIRDVVLMLGASETEAEYIFTSDEAYANSYVGVPIVEQTLEYVGNCNDIPNVRAHS